MGLDMYLEKKIYVGNKWKKPSEMIKVSIPKKNKEHAFAVKKINSQRISVITEEVGYWRKANAIHNWFIQNCGEGNDDCREMYVSNEQMQELLDICKKVLKASKLVKGKIKNGQRSTPTGWEDVMVDGEFIKDPVVAMELLPTTSGFFFGSTEYDQYYLDDIKNTIKILTSALKDDPSGEFYYSASW